GGGALQGDEPSRGPAGRGARFGRRELEPALPSFARGMRQEQRTLRSCIAVGTGDAPAMRRTESDAPQLAESGEAGGTQLAAIDLRDQRCTPDAPSRKFPIRELPAHDAPREVRMRPRRRAGYELPGAGSELGDGIHQGCGLEAAGRVEVRASHPFGARDEV